MQTCIYTKVNRCLTEGRRAFSERLEEIEAGAECERLAGALSALVDGEASGADLALLRPHLRTCLACRTRLREFRAAPGQVAALVPPVALAAGHGGGLRGLLESLVGAAQHKAAAMGERAHAAVELAAGQKVAAVAASAAALAGGGTAVDRLAAPDPPQPRTAERTVEARPATQRLPASEPPAPTVEPQPAADPAPAPAAAPQPPPEPADEFDPVAAASAPPPASAPAAATAGPADSAFSPGGSTAAGGAGGGEFAP